MAHDRSSEEPEHTPFKVVDRRRFTASGTVKPGGEDALAEDRRRPVPKFEATSSAEAAPRAGAEGRPRPQPEAFSAQQRSASQEPPAAPRPQAPRRSQVDFMAFVASLATNAMAALGLMPEGQGGGMAPNPNLAREYIEIIFMLEERTVGNLTDDEAAGIRQLLSDLRLQYVEATRPPSPPPPY